ncbi:MAG: hypothetical protein NTV01_20080 [Bacteroidia bacterium]|nr:hypothetical protein [Bacteroidia bacterium]
MKKIIILVLAFSTTVSVFSQLVITQQTIHEYDNIKIRTLEIYKKDDSSGKKDEINIDQLHVDSKFEKLIGKEYKKEKVYDDAAGLPADMKINQENLSKLNHPYRKQRITIPGLELMLPVDKRELVELMLSTPQYHIVLENGKEIYVGMTADQLSAIFPKSYSKKYLEELGEWQGKYRVVIFFTDVFQGETRIWDRTLGLIINKESMKVELIYTNTPN